MVMECKQLAQDFANVAYSHCLREANEVPHELAQNPFSEITSKFCKSIITDFISRSIVNHLSIILLFEE